MMENTLRQRRNHGETSGTAIGSPAATAGGGDASFFGQHDERAGNWNRPNKRSSPSKTPSNVVESASASAIPTQTQTKTIKATKSNRSSRATKRKINSRSSQAATHYTGPSYVVAKWMILRLLGVIYLLAFLGAHYQNKGLMGKDGLIPATRFMDQVSKQHATPWQGFMQHPTLFWFFDIHDDAAFDVVHKAGIGLSALVVLGQDSMIFMSVLWLLHFTIVTGAGATSFYAYGWESQILETGFLAIFLCDVFPRIPFVNRSTSFKSKPSEIILWLFRWLCFRISIGAGLIKIRGDSCWTDKTCLFYHFETQPIPSPLSFIFHFLPKWMLSRAVDLDLFVQVYTSWMVLLVSTAKLFPNRNNGNTRNMMSTKAAKAALDTISTNMLRMGGIIQAGFMINIILSGNFAFLNHLTIIPALACLDDACWPRALQLYAWGRTDFEDTKWYSARTMIHIAVLGLIGSLSWPVIDNLFQLSNRHQVMNASFDRFRLVNTYGAFGSVGKARYEPILSVSYDGIQWIELEFPCKPGSVTRRPCFCAPYHYRLDWNIWFIGFKPHKRMLHGREKWLFTLIAKLLENGKDISERPWLDLLDITSANMLTSNYVGDGRAGSGRNPKYAKVDMYHYEMAAPLWEILASYVKNNGEAVWWNRTYEEQLLAPVQLNSHIGGHINLGLANLPSIPPLPPH